MTEPRKPTIDCSLISLSLLSLTDRLARLGYSHRASKIEGHRFITLDGADIALCTYDEALAAVKRLEAGEPAEFKRMSNFERLQLSTDGYISPKLMANAIALDNEEEAAIPKHNFGRDFDEKP